jgi:hypothetical protein
MSEILSSAPLSALEGKQPEVVKQEEKFPTEVIDLPSRGLIYPESSPLSSGKIEMRYMTAQDEDILSTQSYIVQDVVFDKLFERLIVSKINYNDLIIGDKNAIMLHAAALGYGEMYETQVEVESGKKIPITINLKEVPYKELDESLYTKGKNEFTFTLPRSKNVIIFKLLTIGDSKKISDDIKGLKKFNMTEKNLTTRLRHMIISVDGDNDQGKINKFVNNMLAVDSRSFREYVSKLQPDVDLNVEVSDPESGETFRGNFEIGLNLFYPDYKS